MWRLQELKQIMMLHGGRFENCECLPCCPPLRTHRAHTHTAFCSSNQHQHLRCHQGSTPAAALQQPPAGAVVWTFSRADLYREHVTHIICSNLPDTKIKQMAHER